MEERVVISCQRKDIVVVNFHKGGIQITKLARGVLVSLDLKEPEALWLAGWLLELSRNDYGELFISSRKGEGVELIFKIERN